MRVVHIQGCTKNCQGNDKKKKMKKTRNIPPKKEKNPEIYQK